MLDELVPDDVGPAAEAEIHALADLDAHPERPDDRVDHEDAEQDQCGGDKEPAGEAFARAQVRWRAEAPGAGSGGFNAS